MAILRNRVFNLSASDNQYRWYFSISWHAPRDLALCFRLDKPVQRETGCQQAIQICAYCAMICTHFPPYPIRVIRKPVSLREVITHCKMYGSIGIGYSS